MSSTWRDSTGDTGAFAFTPAAPVSGSARPAPGTVFPAELSLNGSTITKLANPVEFDDAATKLYVDSTVRPLVTRTLNVSADGSREHSPFISERGYGCLNTVGGDSLSLDLPLPFGAVVTSVTM